MGVHIKNNGIINDIRLLTTDLVRQLDNRVSHLSKVRELYASFLNGELGPWLDTLMLMVQTQLERASRHKTITSGQEVKSDD